MAVACGSISWMQAPLTFKARCFGDSSFIFRLKSWGVWCGVRTLSLCRGKQLRVVSSIPIVDRSAGSGVFGKIVSQPLLPVSVSIFPLVHERMSHSASFWCFSEKIALWVVVDLVLSMEGGVFRILVLPSWTRTVDILFLRGDMVCSHKVLFLRAHEPKLFTCMCTINWCGR